MPRSTTMRTHHPPTTLAARKNVIKDGIEAEVLDAPSTNSHTTARPNPLLHSFLASRGDFSRLTSRTSSFQRLLKRKKLLVGRVILSRSNYAASRRRRSSSTKTAQPDCYPSQASTVRLPAVPSLPKSEPTPSSSRPPPSARSPRRASTGETGRDPDNPVVVNQFESAISQDEPPWNHVALQRNPLGDPRIDRRWMCSLRLIVSV
jgi:hypothetical protein